MAMDGVSNPDVTSNDTKEVYKSDPSSRNETPETPPESGIELASAVTSVAITESAKKINDFAEELEKIEDPREREQAKEGLNRMVNRLAEGGDDEKTARFAASLESYRSSDPASIPDTFVEAGGEHVGLDSVDEAIEEIVS